MNRLFPTCIALLLLNASIFAKPYKGGELYSLDSVKYGRFEIRMRMSNGPGVVSSFFLYYNNSYMGGSEPWREIDIEALGNAKNRFQSNLITGTAGSRTMSEQIYTAPTSICDNYHTYTIEWTPDSIVWYLDGNKLRKTTGKPAVDCQAKGMTLRFNDWISADPAWLGAVNPALLPTYHFIHWIKYYAYTPGAGTGGSSYTLRWTDDFDTFSSNRWLKGNWTFDGNLVDFFPNNIVVQNSMCIICVTDSAHPGFSGIVPPDYGSSVAQGPRSGFTAAAPGNANVIFPLVNILNSSFSKPPAKTNSVLFSINGRAERNSFPKVPGLHVIRTPGRPK